MRILIFGYHNIGYFATKELINFGEDIVGVITHADSPNENIWFNSIRDLAFENYIPVYQPKDVNDPKFINVINNLKPDIIFSFYFRQVFSKDILNIPLKGCINLHGSLLPKYRGRCPVNWVLVNGERETGVTLHYMEEKPDKGDIIAQRSVIIDDEDTALTLFNKMTEASAVLMRETFPLIKSGKASRVPQDQKEASYYGGRKPEDGKIDWSKSARDIYNLIRAVTHPYPGAFTFLNMKKIYIWQANVLSNSLNSLEDQPGMIKDISDDGIVVSTGKGRLAIRHLQMNGGEELMAAQFAKQHNLERGMVFQKG